MLGRFTPAPVAAALRTLGYDPVMVEFAGDAVAWLAELATGRFDLVFNLCEGLGNEAVGEPVAAALVELLGIPLTGASADALALCLRKDRANAVLRAHGIRVPDWIEQPLGRYYLYFAHHDGRYIRLAYADDVHGPWQTHEPGVLPLEASHFGGHIASPDAHVDEERRRIRLYYHGAEYPSGSGASRGATSSSASRA